VDGVMQGKFPVHAHHGPASLLMPILAVWRRKGQNDKCGKKYDKTEDDQTFAYKFSEYATKCKRSYIILAQSSIYFC
jgi:hypothetical protein